MADTKEKIYRIKFEGTDDQTKKIIELKEAIKKLNDEQTNLNLKKGETSKRNEEIIIETKNLTAQINEQRKAILTNAKATQDGADTLEKMRARLALMHKEYEKTPVGTDAMNKQAQAMKILQLEINKADEATGRYNGNVGNYTNSIIAALKALRDKEIVMKKELLLLTEGTKEYEKQSKAIEKLESDIKETEQAGEDFTKGTEKAKGLVVGAFQSMGLNITAVQETINGAKLAIIGMEAATTNGAVAMKVLKIAIASTGIGLLIIAIGELVAYFQSSGDRADKFLKIIAPFKQVFNEVQKAIFGFIDSLSVAFDWIAKVTGLIGDEQQKLIDQQDDYDDAMRASIVENAKMERQRAELMFQLAQKDKFNADQRIELAKQILKIDDDLFNKKVLLAKQDLENTKQKYELENNMSDEALIDVENKTAELENLKTEQYQRGLKLQSRMATLLEQDVKQETRATDEKIKLIEKEIERRKELEDLRLKMMEEAQRIFDEQLVKTESENIEDYKKEVYVDPLMDPIVQAQIAQQEAIRNEIQKTADLEELTFQTKLRNFDNYAQMLNATKSLLSKNTVAYKAMATAEALISTYTAIAKTLKEPALPWPSNVIMSAIIGAQGFMNVAEINKVKFAKGGIVGGNTHENGGTVYRGSDGQVFEAERGELIAVVNRHDTERLRMLSAANSLHGRPFFASGGIMTPTTDFSDRKMRAIIRETVASITEIPVVVSERDISKSQRRVSVIENAGNL